ncbi:MAG: hypothetical protein KatS3mg057_3241 [Herpetosiphonaceae bacterium]|nr:MAG: hypothetical protein KatS3mg057_3241 [Herpetosiphonaceae bacterium]
MLPSLRSWLGERSTAERRTLARLWQLASGEDVVEAETLLEGMLTPHAIATLLSRLRPVDRAALERLQAEGGALQMHILEREFGTVRDHRTYPNPRAYLEALAGPPSATERLYVLGLIQQCKTPSGAVYAIPGELLELLPPVPLRDRRFCLPPVEPQNILPGDPGRIERALVGLLATAYETPLPVGRSGELRRLSGSRWAGLLAASLDQTGATGEPLPSERTAPRMALLRHLALDLGLLRRTRGGLRPAPTALAWLGLSAQERRQSLLQAWLVCQWDELTALCGLRWRSVPLRRSYETPRRALLEMVAQLAPGQWFALDDWVSEIRRINPDFQRPDGLYDTWMLVDDRGRSVVGFQHWEAVEGRLARAVITGPLAWLGLVDLGRQPGEEMWSAARLNSWGAALLRGEPVPSLDEERFIVEASFTVFVPPLVPPLPRFQLSRFADWEGHGAFDIYRLTRAGFNRALDRGIGVEEILAFLDRWSAESIPQNVAFTLRQWAADGEELRLRPVLLLEAQDPLRLEQLRRDRRLALPPAEPLGERAWAMAEADGAALLAALRRAGYGVAAELPTREEPLSERDLAALLTYAEVVARLTEACGVEGGPSAALRRRIERRLSTATLAAARREAITLTQRLCGYCQESEEEQEH